MSETAPHASGHAAAWLARLSPAAARAVLGGLALAAVLLLYVSIGLTEPVQPGRTSDLDVYQSVVAALRGGEGYYAALHKALIEGGYGTLSPLNWRTPAFLTLLSWFPSLESAHVFLALLTGIAWLMGVALVYRRSGTAAAIAAAVVLAASLCAIFAWRAELSVELFAGTLILASVSAYGLGWRWLGFALAVLVLFVRELAGPYVVVCLSLAIAERRRDEALAWIVALLAYAAFYAWHWMQLTAQITPADHAATGWLQLGGLGFVLRTAAYNGVLLAAPYWLAALVLVFGIAGALNLPRAAFTVGLFLLLFLFVGRPENEYWGSIYTPLVALGLISSPATLTALVARSRRSS
jgi:hypothetical protein